jgi:phosphoribosylglycinamide formyltransferase-1
MANTRIAIFASGKGSNALNLIRFFEGHNSIQVAFVLSNNANATILSSAGNFGITTFQRTNNEVADGAVLLDLCKGENIDWIILAGYLRLIPQSFLAVYNNKIINLHPSLLPKYGGEGMYGRKVHMAVLHNRDIESGITVHFVNEEYDEGKIIAQLHCEVASDETIEVLENKIRQLEQLYFPFIVQNTILTQSDE